MTHYDAFTWEGQKNILNNTVEDVIKILDGIWVKGLKQLSGCKTVSHKQNLMAHN